jgi:protein disulfide-isomerase A1
LAAKSLATKGIKLGAVDCSEEKSICESHGIRGYPTLKVFREGRSSDFDGGRQSEEIVKFMEK